MGRCTDERKGQGSVEKASGAKDRVDGDEVKPLKEGDVDQMRACTLHARGDTSILSSGPLRNGRSYTSAQKRWQQCGRSTVM